MLTLQKSVSPAWENILARWVLKPQDPNRISLKGVRWERVPVYMLAEFWSSEGEVL